MKIDDGEERNDSDDDNDISDYEDRLIANGLRLLLHNPKDCL